MNPLSSCVEEFPGGLKIRVKVHPRASKNEISGVREGVLQVRLTSPPVEGAANKQLVRLLSKKLGLAKSWIEIDSGEKARHKRIFIRDISVSFLEKKITAK